MAINITNVRATGAEDTVGRTTSELLVSVLGMSNKTKKVALYTILVTTKEPITGLSLNNMISGQYGISYNKAYNGDNISPTRTDEEDPSAEVSFTFAEDYNYVHDNTYGASRYILLACLRGETFKIGDEVITVVGTNGTIITNKTTARKNEMNLDFGGLLNLEGELLKRTKGVSDGKISLTQNVFRYMYNQMAKTVALEFRMTSGSGKQNTFLLPYVNITNASRDEADQNSYAVDGTRGCDVWERDDYFSEPNGIRPDFATEKGIVEAQVDYIAEGSARPEDASAGETLASVDPATGIVKIYKYASTWTEVEGGEFARNCRLFSLRKVADTNKVTEVNCFIAIKEATPQGDVASAITGKAYKFDLNEGAGNKNYICEVNNYNRESQKFEPYSSIVLI